MGKFSLFKKILFLLVLGSGMLFGQTTRNVPSTAYPTIQSAINASVSGDIVEVAAGTYTETFNLNKDVTVRGPNHNVSGTGSRAAEAIFRNAKANVTRGTLIGFRFEKSNEADYSGNGPVGVSGNNPATVKNNVFVSTTSGFGNNGWVGIEVAMGTGNKIIDSNFFTKGSGFLVKQWRAGMWVNSTIAGFEITNNTFDNVNTALNMDYEHPGIVVEGNTFNSNNGTQVSFGGAPSQQYVWGPNTFELNNTLFNNSNVATSFRLDVTSSTFGGKLGSAMTDTELFNVEGRMYHRDRTASTRGLIIYKAEHEFVSRTAMKIQSAVDYAEPGFTIHVYQGNFNEAVVIDKDNLTLLGYQYETAVTGRTNPTANSETRVQAPNGGYAAFTTTTAGAQNLTIKGFSIRGDNGGAGIDVKGNVNNMHVEGNLFSNFSGRLSFAPSAGSQNVTFTKNRVLNTSQSGPYFPNGSTGVVNYNIIDGVAEAGVILEGSGNDVAIQNNIITNNDIGVWVLGPIAGGNAPLGINTLVSENNLEGNTTFFKNERTSTLQTSCNWYGSAAAPDPAKIDGNVNVPTYLNSDDSSTNLGFVPTGECLEPMGPIIVLDTTDTYVASYPSIQDAIDDATTQNGYTVVVVPSDFTEPAQVVVHKSVTIRGNSTDRDDTVVRSNYNTIAGDQGESPGSAWFITNPGTEVTIKDLTLDGNGKTIFGAVRFLDDGLVHNVHIRNIYHSIYKGTAVQAYNGNVDVTYSKFTNIQRTGAHYSAANHPDAVVSGTFDHNEYIGKGAGNWLDFALDIGGDTNVTVTYNEISNNLGVASDNSNSAGVVITTLHNPLANNVVIKNNKINNTRIGVSIGWSNPDYSYVEIDENDFTGNNWFIINYDGALSTIVNGCNWYGTTDIGYITPRIYQTNFDSYLPSGANNTLFGFKPADDCITCLDDPVKNIRLDRVYCTIQSAIDDPDILPGDTITVKPGTYEEAVTIGAGLDGLTLIGSVDANGAPTSIINPGSLGDGVSTNGSHNLTIQNFEITGSTGRGIIVKNADGVLLDNLNVHHNNSDGIRVDKAIDATVQNSISDNNKVGLIFYALGEIKDNIVSNARYRGIFAVPGTGGGYTSGDLLISGNEVFGNWTDHAFTEWRVGGIIYYDNGKVFNGNVTIENNTSYDNYGPGINVYKLNESETTGLTLEVSGNIVYGNKDALDRGVGDGIVLYLSNYVTVHENEVYDNENAGIRISNDYRYNSYYPTSNNTLTGNIIRDNERGIYIQGNNSNKIAGIVINENAIYDNTIAGLEVSNNGAEDVDAECNWWGQASGPVAGDILITNGSTGTVSSTPFLIDGTDASADTGFQPAVGCSACPDNPVTNLDTNEVFCTIQEAIDAPNTLDGHTIEVIAGTYPENVNIDKSVTLRGPNYLKKGNDGTRDPEAIIDGNVKITKADVTLEGFAIHTGDNKRAVEITAGSGVLIKNNIVDGLTTSTNSAIWYGSALGVTHIEGNLIQNFTTAGWKIMFDGNENSEIYFNDNELANMNSGIIFQASMKNSVGEITNNILSANSWPVVAIGSSSKLVSGNTITNGGIYIIGNNNPALDRGNNNTIVYNTFTGNGYYINVDNYAHSGNKVNYNAFLRDGQVVHNAHAGSKLDATCNWWNSTDENEISGWISGAGTTYYVPFMMNSDLYNPICLDPEALSSMVGITTKEKQKEIAESWWPEEVPNGYLVLDGDELGMVVTYMTTPERNAMSHPVRGMLIYNTTEDCVQLYSGTWNCIEQGDPKALRTVRVGMWTNTVVVPQPYYQNLMQQLLTPGNYGTSGTFKGAEFDPNYIDDLHSTWSGLSALDLMEQYDLLVVGFKDASVADAEKVKTFVDGGGVVLVIMDSNVGTNYNLAFGGNGAVSAGGINAMTTGDAVNNGVFGDARIRSISSGGTYGVGRFLESDLPAGANIFAWETADGGNQYPAAWSTGKGSRAYFIWGFDAMSSAMSGSGSISSDADVFFHNMMAEMLKKKGFSAD